MNERQTTPAGRSRFGNLTHRTDVPEETFGRETERYGQSFRSIADAIGARELGYSLTSVDPGRCSGPFHFHHSEEEAFFVLEGRGRLRQGDGNGEDEWIDLRPGDCVAYPAGTGIAHQLVNTGDTPLVYLAISTRVRADVAEFPDSDKVLIRATRMMLRRGPQLDYFDGES